MSNHRPRALVLEAPGINCDEETAFAIEQAGGEAEKVHISQLLSREKRLGNFAILALSGGFSYGDAIRSGAILGLQLKTHLSDELNAFVEQGKPIIGICNGFQVLVETGLLPYGRIDENQPKTASLIHNESGKFEARWVTLSIGQSACQFVCSVEGEPTVTVPVAHAEGRFIAPELAIPDDQVVFRYATSQGVATEAYAANPNGSPNGIAGITDRSGVVLGMMPHPERNVLLTQQPNWRAEPRRPYGQDLFNDLVQYARDI